MAKKKTLSGSCPKRKKNISRWFEAVDYAKMYSNDKNKELRS